MDSKVTSENYRSINTGQGTIRGIWSIANTVCRAKPTRLAPHRRGRSRRRRAGDGHYEGGGQPQRRVPPRLPHAEAEEEGRQAGCHTRKPPRPPPPPPPS